MDATNLYWMAHSINISKKGPLSKLQVGAVLVSNKNELICSAFSNEDNNSSWCSVLLRKLQYKKISNAQSIYVTINTLSHFDVFDLSELLKEIQINEIYIGLPDPVLTSYLNYDPLVKLNNVYRYPDQLQREILMQNDYFFASSKQNIRSSPYYSENRISDLVIEKLKAKDIIISREELNSNKKESALASLICNRYENEYFEAIETVHTALSEAFNSKYGSYNYSDDARSFDSDWKESFKGIYKSSIVDSISNIKVLNVGVGSGQEAAALFLNCKNVTFVDIAKTGLEKIKKRMPWSKTITTSAVDLSSISDNSHELYVSLRTYNSSFFDIKTAISEAHRVLKPKATLIISVANGFLCPERHCIIPGLLIPGTGFVDIYRGMDTAKLVLNEFNNRGLNDVQLVPANTEIYLSATTY